MSSIQEGARTTMPRILAFASSTRRESFNKKLVAIAAQDVEKAKEHLLKAGLLPDGSNFSSFGPSMMLAKELLELGEREVVIQYLKQCANFWHTPDHRAEKWIYAVEKGTTPNFGANLAY